MQTQSSNGGNGSASPETPAVTSYQAFTMERRHRGDLKNAPYNPRFLSQRAKVKLKTALEKVGLVQPLVWNKRTGNLVGGHQRIKSLDALNGSADYWMDVAVLDVDLPREKELNVLLNNVENVGGEWDLEKLKQILDDQTVELPNTGFDAAEFMKMFGEAASQPGTEHQDELTKQLAGVKEAYEKLAVMNRSKDDTDFYSVVVFGSYNERKEFYDEFGFEDNRYIDGRTLVQILRDLKKSQATGQGTEGNNPGVA
jgi:hypothetical protein